MKFLFIEVLKVQSYTLDFWNFPMTCQRRAWEKSITMISGTRSIPIILCNVSSWKVIFMVPTLSNIAEVSTFCHQDGTSLLLHTGLKKCSVLSTKLSPIDRYLLSLISLLKVQEHNRWARTVSVQEESWFPLSPQSKSQLYRPSLKEYTTM
jgi:hypothetical protein